MELYNYQAKVLSVYDGDTIRCDIDLGFSMILSNQAIRLYGIDTPEVRGEEREEGLKVRDVVRDLILNKNVILQTIKDTKGKYGRWLGKVYLDDLCVNDFLIENGYAKPYLK